MPEFRLVIGNRKYSSWSMRGWLVMKLAGVDFTETQVRLYLPESPALLAEHSPSKEVPYLLHGDRGIWNSLAIAEYMAEQAPDDGIWPVDPGTRALARSVTAEMHAGFSALRRLFPMDMTQHHEGLLPGEAEQRDVTRIDALWGECLTSSGGPFLFGAWSVAYCFYAPVVSRFETYGFALSAEAAAYTDQVKAHAHYAEWFAGAQAEPWEIPLETLVGP